MSILNSEEAGLGYTSVAETTALKAGAQAALVKKLI